ncbi:hypothetical protein JM93_00950 [Roseibium hamelinense]|uniref:Short-subunit dehydrogenase n=1 Tax=Roseibium hamelinense TaxID=150831 RepID=A0A562TIW9_9HYPH|nr:SDR family NAD(P)-dependent oxidoreductase [Roseibium hamelinense]MTI42747.1 SDR family NAD(P)-dependent oxidoreductase [Roseibium hamelinense]TWI93393.1 hypothetical protein JM93_00950 [Roseibium hamelinense]
MKNAPKSALITGANRGIGAAFAGALPATTDLLLSARNEADLKDVADHLELPGRSIEAFPADLSQPAAVEQLTAEAEARNVDLLILNAGVGHFGAFLDRDFQDHQAVLDVNIRAVMSLAHSLLPGMIARAKANKRRAGIIIMGSTAGFVPVPQLAAYAASKAFILSFSEALAAELARQPVDVLCVCPGAVKTEFADAAGYGGSTIPGAQSPATIASDALSALGRRRTLILDPAANAALKPVALARAALAEAIKHGISALKLRDRAKRRSRR